MGVSRRSCIGGILSAAVLPPRIAQSATAGASATTLKVTSRTIDVRGKPAKVYGIVQASGVHGLAVDREAGFHVRLQNDIGEPTLVHWHGMTPDWRQDGVPGISQDLLIPGNAYEYQFALTRSGTHWMHSHHGLQEQQLLAAPLIVKDQMNRRRDEQDVTMLLHDFTFRDPSEILAELAGGAGAPMDHSQMGHGQMNANPNPASTDSQRTTHGNHAGGMDLNDVNYDAFLANDRTLADPEVVRVERGVRIRLRIINAASSTNFIIDTGLGQAAVIAVDGNPVTPVRARLFPIAVAQRLDLQIELPRALGALPILARQEGTTAQTGIILAKPGLYVRRPNATNEHAGPRVGLELERRLIASTSLPPRPINRRQSIDLTGGMSPYAWGFDGKLGAAIEPMRVKEGERVVWTLKNKTDMAHPIHLHGHHFQVVRIGDTILKGAMRDTILIPVGEEVDIAFDADNPGRWAFHCHHLYHMVTGMMTTVEYDA